MKPVGSLAARIIAAASQVKPAGSLAAGATPAASQVKPVVGTLVRLGSQAPPATSISAATAQPGAQPGCLPGSESVVSGVKKQRKRCRSYAERMFTFSYPQVSDGQNQLTT